MVFGMCLFSLLMLVSCSKKKELTLGSVEKNVYKNDYFGLEIPVIDNWVVYTEAELEGLMQSTTDLIQDVSDGKMDLSEADVFFTFAMRDEEDINLASSQLNVAVEKVGFVAAITSTKAYAENAIKQFEEFNIGFECSEVKEREINGKKFSYYETTLPTLGEEWKQAQYIAKTGNYYLCVSFSAFTKEGYDQLADVVSKMKLK